MSQLEPTGPAPELSLAGRIGLAITRPRAALAVAGDRRHAGRSGTDLIVAMIVLVLATQLRALVGAVWLGAAIEPLLGVHAVVQTLTEAFKVDLGFLFVGAFVLYLAAGRRRDLGRSFDLACVAVLPLVLVDLVASIVVHALALELTGPAVWGITVLAWAWSGSLLAIAVADVRSRRAVDAGDPGVARGAGWALAGIAAGGLALQIVWLVQNMESVRPMTTDDPAPEFALPRIGPQGALGPKLALSTTAGKVTVIDFWATWCNPCLASLPHLDEFARRHPDVAVLAVDLDDPVEARALFDKRGYAMTLLEDDRETSARYGVTQIPHTVIVDRTGLVHRVLRGGGGADLEAEVAKLLR